MVEGGKKPKASMCIFNEQHIENFSYLPLQTPKPMCAEVDKEVKTDVEILMLQQRTQKFNGKYFISYL